MLEVGTAPRRGLPRVLDITWHVVPGKSWSEGARRGAETGPELGWWTQDVVGAGLGRLGLSPAPAPGPGEAESSQCPLGSGGGRKRQSAGLTNAEA